MGRPKILKDAVKLTISLDKQTKLDAVKLAKKRTRGSVSALLSDFIESETRKGGAK